MVLGLLELLSVGWLVDRLQAFVLWSCVLFFVLVFVVRDYCDKEKGKLDMLSRGVGWKRR